MVNLLKKLLKIIKMKALPFQETGASSQRSFPESLHFPRLQFRNKTYQGWKQKQKKKKREEEYE